jgi:transcriptional regulator with GAF, ATPase, and Fis domain
MAKKHRTGRFSLKEDRQLIQMAAASATVEEAAAILRTSVETIERKAERLGIQLKRKRPRLGLKAKK